MKEYKFMISIIHILFIGPALVYLGHTHQNIDTWLNYVLLLSGIAIASYHGYLVYKRGGIKPGFMYFLHASIFAPLLIYTAIVGLMKKPVFWGVKKLLIMIGFASIGYHILKITTTN